MELLLKDLRTFLFARSRQFLEDFIDFISGPKTFLRSASEYTSENLARAFSFAVILYVLVNLLFVFLMPKGIDLGTFVAFNIAYAVLFLGIVLLALQVSWLVVAARPPLRRVLLCFLYFAGIGMLLQVLLLVPIVMIMHPLDQTLPLMDHYNVLLEEDPAAAEAFLERNPSLPGRLLGVGITFVVYLLLDLAWVIVVWGAFRQLAGTGRLRSAVAMTVFFVLATGIFFVSLMFGDAFFSGMAASSA